MALPPQMVDTAMGPGGPAELMPEELQVELPGMEDELPAGIELAGEEQVVEVETEQYDHNANLAEVLDDSILGELSSDLMGKVDDDKSSREDWEQAIAKGLTLLGINYEERTEPFMGASGVTHPLLAEAVTQFQAQAYKEMLPPGGPVKTQIIGQQNQAVEDQAQRVKDFMNYQITEVMEEFDQDTDQMLFYLPITGSTFKKVYFDPNRQRAVSKFVPAEDLIVPYAASDLRTAERYTHVVRMTENEIRKMQVNGLYKDVNISPMEEDESDSTIRGKTDEIQGLRTGYSDDMYTIYEVHVDLDLEGFEDLDEAGDPTGIKLPYIVTMDEGSGKVLSVVRNYRESDPLRRKRMYFVHYKFLPGLGFYGFGLIHMIGGLGKAATSILRQLIDAGTLANLPSGFKARGIRIRNDDEPLAPGEFRDIDAPGGDIRNSIIPLPFKEPSATLAQLLGVLIESGRRFVSIADQQTSNMSQDMPVGTTVALLERGMKVMSAIHKRLHYAQKTEFRLIAALIRDYLPPNYPYQVIGGDQMIKQADFDDRVDVIPVSDPNIFSMAQRVTLAQTQLQLAQSNPEMHNLHSAYRRMYQALEVQNIDEILPPPPQPQPTDPSIENARALAGQILQAFEQQDHDAHIAAHTAMLMSPIVQATPSVYGMFVSHCMEHIAFKARAMVTQEIQQNMEQMQSLAQVGAIDPRLAQVQPQIPPEQIESRVAQVQAQLTAQFLQSLQPPQEGQQDPLVAIRQQELMIKAAENERQAQLDREKMMLEQQKLQQRAATDAARIESQEEIADQRAEVNMTRIQVQQQNMNRRQT